jgi:hypothetical protein
LTKPFTFLVALHPSRLPVFGPVALHAKGDVLAYHHIQHFIALETSGHEMHVVAVLVQPTTDVRVAPVPQTGVFYVQDFEQMSNEPSVDVGEIGVGFEIVRSAEYVAISQVVGVIAH